MKRAAALFLIALTLTLALAPTASANWVSYKHFLIVNPTSMNLYYDVSWDGGLSWQTSWIGANSQTIHWNLADGVSAMVRFDADLTGGVAWRTYNLEVTVSNHQPNVYTHTHRYRFVTVGTSLLDVQQ